MNSKIFKLSVWVLCVLSFFEINAQENGHYLKKITDSLRFSRIESQRILYNDSFKIQLEQLLNEDDAYSYSWDSIKQTVSVLNSQDGKLKVITWVLLNDKEEFNVFGVVLYKKKSSANTQVFWLKNQEVKTNDVIYEDLSSDLWLGALYYQIYDFKRKGKQYYCLLGLNGKTSFFNQKIIDVIWIDKNNDLHLGAPVFYGSKSDYTPQFRVIYEYADQSAMLLRFEADIKVIVFSNLVPSQSNKLGQTQYYIPDGRLDFYLLNKKGKWIKNQDFEMWDTKNKRLKEDN